MDPEKTNAQPFDAEDTGDLDIPVEMQKAAEEAVYGKTQKPFDSEETTEFEAEFNLTDEKLKDDSLVSDRLLDLQRLAPIISDNSVDFNQATMDPRDHVVEQRLNQYQVEKDYGAAPKEEFYEESGLAPDDEEKERLTQQQRVLLNTVQRLSDGVGFEEVHPDLNRNETLRPTSAPIDDYRPPVTELEEVPVDNPSSRYDGATIQANMTYEKYQVLTGQKESTELVDRDKAPHPVVTIDRDSLRRRSKPISVEMMIGIGLVLLAVPLFGWSIYRQSHADAEADRIQTEQSAALASESADKHSLANQMDEPFRMPAGAVGPIGGGGGYASDGQKAAPGSAGSELANWKPPAHPTPEPTPVQLAENRKILSQADQLEALGHTTQAAALLNAALGRCPGDVNLVIAAARKYMQIRDYATARTILQAAMRGARTLGDYSLLMQVLNQLPQS